MIEYIGWRVTCDGCGKIIVFPNISVKGILRQIEAEGWKSTDFEDFCPDCKAHNDD